MLEPMSLLFFFLTSFLLPSSFLFLLYLNKLYWPLTPAARANAETIVFCAVEPTQPCRYATTCSSNLVKSLHSLSRTKLHSHAGGETSLALACSTLPTTPLSYRLSTSVVYKKRRRPHLHFVARSGQ